MLLGPDLRLARDWKPFANIANTLYACAGDTGFRKLLRHLASPAQWLLLQLFVAFGRSSRLFRPLLLEMRLRTLFVVKICRDGCLKAMDGNQCDRIPKTVACARIWRRQPMPFLKMVGSRPQARNGPGLRWQILAPGSPASGKSTCPARPVTEMDSWLVALAPHAVW